MKFTEAELTVAVEAVARRAYEAVPTLLRRRLGATTWHELPRAKRYDHLVVAGDLVLEALVALPERPTVGAAPVFTDDEYEHAARTALQGRTERARPGSWEQGSDRRRRRAVATNARLLQVAVAAMPVRADPDAFVVPDHL